MSDNPFKKAIRQSAKLKLAITGPSGSGKTTGALRLARGLVGPKGRIAVIDTENRSASLFADVTDFDVLDLAPPFEHSKFSEAITAAEANGYDAVIIDSASHLWEAILAYKDKLDRRGGNSYTNWNEAGGKFREVVDCLLASDLHVISCLRSKMEHSIEKDDKGRTTIRKVGMAPIMRDGIEYEFTLVLDLDMQHQAVSSKDRTRMFDGKIIEITEGVGEQLAKWLAGDEPVASKPFAKSESKNEDHRLQLLAKIKEAWTALKKTDADIVKACKFAGASCVEFSDLDQPQMEKLLKELQRQMNVLAETNSTAPEPPKKQEKKKPNFDPLPPSKTVEDVPMHHAADLEKALPEGSEDAVNAYLTKLHWIKQGQTFRDLDNDQIGKIMNKLERFFEKAGVKTGEK